MFSCVQYCTSDDALVCGSIGYRSRPFPYGSELFLPVTCLVPNRFHENVLTTRTMMTAMMMMMSFSFVLSWCRYNVEIELWLKILGLSGWLTIGRRPAFFLTLERAGNLRKGNTHYSSSINSTYRTREWDVTSFRSVLFLREAQGNDLGYSKWPYLGNRGWPDFLVESFWDALWIRIGFSDAIKGDMSAISERVDRSSWGDRHKPGTVLALGTVNQKKGRNDD